MFPLVRIKSGFLCKELHPDPHKTLPLFPDLTEAEQFSGLDHIFKQWTRTGT